MKSSHIAGLALAAAAILAGSACSDGTTEPEACPANTTSVTATVTKNGSDVVFDWAPRCPVALVLVEDDDTGEDQWAVSSPGLTETSTTTANTILPSINYGAKPAGTEEDPAAVPLVAGKTYNLVLWMIVPSSSTCAMRIQNGCLASVKAFVK